MTTRLLINLVLILFVTLEISALLFLAWVLL